MFAVVARCRTATKEPRIMFGSRMTGYFTFYEHASRQFIIWGISENTSDGVPRIPRHSAPRLKLPNLTKFFSPTLKDINFLIVHCSLWSNISDSPQSLYSLEHGFRRGLMQYITDNKSSPYWHYFLSTWNHINSLSRQLMNALIKQCLHSIQNKNRNQFNLGHSDQSVVR